MSTHPDPHVWHPALEAAMRDRPVLREALRDDARLLEHLRVLSSFLTALRAHAWTQWEDLPGHLVADLLPSDRDLLDARTRHAAALRAMELQPAPSVVWVRPVTCPECKAGKHVNCTGESLSPTTDLMVPCVCDHKAATARAGLADESEERA